MFNTEVWLPISGFEGYYEVSNTSEIASCQRIVGRKPRQSIKERFVLKQHLKEGYMYVALSINGKSHFRYVHRLVAQCFVPNPESKPCVNHKDGNKLNNAPENLEWVTRSENTNHAYKNKLIDPFKNKGVRRLDKEKVLLIKASSLSKRELSRNFGVTTTTIKRIKNGEIWEDEHVNHASKMKPIQEIDQKGMVIGEYKSIAEAQKVLGIRNVSAVCIGLKKHTKGRIFRFAIDKKTLR